MVSKPEDEKYMRLAIRRARKGIEQGQTPFGACIVRDGKILACEHNRVWATTDITAHAEIMAVRAACRKIKQLDLSGATIYSTCEPCPMCLAACHWARIGRVVFGAAIADAHKCGFHELLISNRSLVRLGKAKMTLQGRVLGAECRALFDDWSGLRRSRPY